MRRGRVCQCEGFGIAVCKAWFKGKQDEGRRRRLGECV